MTVLQTHTFLVGWGAVEVVLFGGVIFGWASLVYIYKQEGIFRDLCDDNFMNITETTSPDDSSLVFAKYNQSSSKEIFPVNISELYQEYEYGSVLKEIHTCHSQDKMFNLIYVLAVVINGVASFPNGVIWDKFGTRVLRLIGIFTFIPGILMASFVTKDTSLLLFPSMIFVAYGGYIVLMSNFQLGNLISNKKSMIISLYCGAYDSSAFVLIFVKLAYTSGLSSKYSFLVYLCLYSVVIVSTFWYMPKRKIPFPLPTGYKVSLSCGRQKKNPEVDKYTVKERENLSIGVNSLLEKDVKMNNLQGNLISSKAVENSAYTDTSEAVEKTANADTPSFIKEAVSAIFLWDIIWLSLMRLQSWSFVGGLNASLERLADGEQEVVSHYTSVYAFMQFFGIVLAPLSGRLMDRKKNRKSDQDLKRIELIEVCIASFLIDNTCGLLLAITMTIPVLEVQYISFVFHVIHRALLYGPNSAFIAQAFSSQNFGKLFGLAMTVSAAISLIQFPLFILVQGPLNGDPLAFNVFIIVLMLIAYGHPIYLSRWCKKKRQQYNEMKKEEKVAK